ncbi:MAG: TetR/AcrR family transcriptional regulator [Solimonas sp.]
MARTKEFDEEQALDAAIGVFAEHGYEGSSTGALLEAMGIGRQSLYDTFGDKRQLFLAALQRYNQRSVAQIIAALDAAASPLAGVESALVAFAQRSGQGKACLGTHSVCEFGDGDAEVTALNVASGRVLREALERRLREAQAAGELAADLPLRHAAQFLSALLSGLRIAARGGSSVQTLRQIARTAVRGLR